MWSAVRESAERSANVVGLLNEESTHPFSEKRASNWLEVIEGRNTPVGESGRTVEFDRPGP
jgi:hypothetical protein